MKWLKKILIKIAPKQCAIHNVRVRNLVNRKINYEHYWTNLEEWSWRHFALCKEARTYNQLLRLQKIMECKADMQNAENRWTFFNSRLYLKVESLDMRLCSVTGEDYVP